MIQFSVHILFEFQNAPWGGGNQFLRGLRRYFQQVGIYENEPKRADVIFFNSHHCVRQIFEVKRKDPGKIFIHRVDGPIYLVRGRDRLVDDIIFSTNKLIADGTIFQSQWSKTRCYEQGLAKTRYNKVIMNAPDPSIFYPENRGFEKIRDIKLIATSWSSNMRKGFDIYKFLDQHLDFQKYKMTFVGNSPITFERIRSVRPLPSAELASALRNHDIYIIASEADPCSNALIEALHCGLPAVARSSGGHPEIVKTSGELFNDERDVRRAIDKVVSNYNRYKLAIRMPTLSEIGKAYYDLARQIYTDVLSGNYSSKCIALLNDVMFQCRYVHLYLNKLKRKTIFDSKR